MEDTQITTALESVVTHFHRGSTLMAVQHSRSVLLLLIKIHLGATFYIKRAVSNKLHSRRLAAALNAFVSANNCRNTRNRDHVAKFTL